MVKLNTSALFELGKDVSEKLVKNGITSDSTLTISVDDESFKKIDEDIFYTFKKEGIIDEEEKFEPSINEVNVSFPKLNIIIKHNS